VIAFKRGRSRCVLVLHWIALKFPRSKWGVRCNLYEAKLYKGTTAWRRELLCPVIWCAPKGIFVVMRAATPLTEEEFNRFDKEGRIPDWKRVPASDEVTPFEEGEDKFADFGWLDGRIVVMDYAAHPNLTHRHVDPYTDEHARTPGYEDF
jgi:hypothetical protein